MPHYVRTLFLSVRKGETVQRLEFDVHVPVLEQFVVEILLREIGIQGYQGVVESGGVGEFGVHSALPVFLHLLLGYEVVGLGFPLPPQHILHIGTVEVGFCEVRVELYGFAVILKRIFQPVHLHEDCCPVVVGQHVARIDVDYPVHIFQSLLVLSHLGVDEAPVVEGEGVSGVLAQHHIQIIHSLVEVLEFVVQQGAVEEGEGAGGIQSYSHIQVGDGLVVILPLSVYPCPSHIALRLVAVQSDGLVVVGQSLYGILEEQV